MQRFIVVVSSPHQNRSLTMNRIMTLFVLEGTSNTPIRCKQIESTINQIYSSTPCETSNIVSLPTQLTSPWSAGVS